MSRYSKIRYSLQPHAPLDGLVGLQPGLQQHEHKWRLRAPVRPCANGVCWGWAPGPRGHCHARGCCAIPRACNNRHAVTTSALLGSDVVDHLMQPTAAASISAASLPMMAAQGCPAQVGRTALCRAVANLQVQAHLTTFWWLRSSSRLRAQHARQGVHSERSVAAAAQTTHLISRRALLGKPSSCAQQ